MMMFLFLVNLNQMTIIKELKLPRNRVGIAIIVLLPLLTNGMGIAFTVVLFLLANQINIAMIMNTSLQANGSDPSSAGKWNLHSFCSDPSSVCKWNESCIHGKFVRCRHNLHYALDVCASEIMCDPVTTGHMLYGDKHQIQYSGVMYVNPYEQCVFMQLFHPTSQKNSYKNEAAFCDDHRNNVLLQLQFVSMIFLSQNDGICGTPTLT
jgi:hypothetical protein